MIEHDRRGNIHLRGRDSAVHQHLTYIHADAEQQVHIVSHRDRIFFKEGGGGGGGGCVLSSLAVFDCTHETIHRISIEDTRRGIESKPFPSPHPLNKHIVLY